jgi:hypothetical protein
LDPKGGRSLCLSGQIYNLLQVQTEIAGFMFASRTYTSNVKKKLAFLATSKIDQSQNDVRVPNNPMSSSEDMCS